MNVKITVRFSHFPTCTPLLEVTISQKDSLKKLRLKLEERLAVEDFSHIRIFSRWYTEEIIHRRKRFVELTSQDENQSLFDLGICDMSLLYLEGPLTDTLEGTGQALALFRVEHSKQMMDINAKLQKLADGQAALAAKLDEAVRLMKPEGKEQQQHFLACPTSGLLHNTPKLIFSS